MIEKIKNELMFLEEGIEFMEKADIAWTSMYTKLCKQRKILKRTLRKLEKLEELGR